MGFFFFLKILIVLFFLVMFLRGSKLVWGIGLLTVTTAFLFDTLLGSFGRDEMVAQLGFFFYVLSGGLFTGAALWLWGLLHPQTANSPFPAVGRTPTIRVEPPMSRPGSTTNNTAFDRQMLYDQIRHRLGPEEILDLIFDLGINENDVVSPNQEITQIIVRIMDTAEQRGQTSVLAMAVERILTPLPPENLPRLEKINSDSPPTVLRQYLLAHFSQQELAQIATTLEIDWEQISHHNKKEMVRGLLLYLYRRNRLPELIDLLHQQPIQPQNEPSP